MTSRAIIRMPNRWAINWLIDWLIVQQSGRTAYLPSMQMIVDMNTRAAFISTAHTFTHKREQTNSVMMVGDLLIDLLIDWLQQVRQGGMNPYQMMSGGHHLAIEISRAHPVADAINFVCYWLIDQLIDAFPAANDRKLLGGIVEETPAGQIHGRGRRRRGRSQQGILSTHHSRIVQSGLWYVDWLMDWLINWLITAMFTYDASTTLYWFNDVNTECMDEFRLIGVLFGLALYNNILVSWLIDWLIYWLIAGGRSLPASHLQEVDEHTDYVSRFGRLWSGRVDF